MAFPLNPEFLKSAQKPTQFPADSGREVAFSGRSNSGKSSAINAITARRGLARTSKTPGRTQLINFFEIDETLRLVDLPGYGYAKVAAAVRQEWRDLLEAYFRERTSLVGLFITVDVRRGLNDLDQVMLAWSRDANVAAAVLLTKADKLKKGQAATAVLEVRKELAGRATVQPFSATKRQGEDEARQKLEEFLSSPRG